MEKEIEIISKLNHDNIIKYHGIFYEEKYIFILLEYANGGHLFD